MKQVSFFVILFVGIVCLGIIGCTKSENSEVQQQHIVKNSSDTSAVVYDTASIPPGPEREFILLGRELFMNTHTLIGPKGTIAQITGNEMDCQNCHLKGGTKPLGQPLVTVSGRYPQYRGREATILTIQDRVNNCLDRPLLGKHLPFDSREMNAFAMYFKWIWDKNKNVLKVNGDIPNTLPWSEKRADWKQGKIDYDQYCARCHGLDGEGVKTPSGYGYTYPPVWGMHSYAVGSSMHRVGKLAAFIRNNMPNDMDITHIRVTEEQAYNIAAYVDNDSINPRPNFHEENVLYPVIKDKPIDYPYGPYADTFSQDQHKFGPFKPIDEYWKSRKK
jgi:thiosulfate dehydrogenase